MPHVDPAWLEHQRKRFTRENAYLYIRPDADRLLGPQARHLLPPNWRRPGDRYADRAASDAPETRGADVSEETDALRFRAEVAAIRFELALIKAARFFRKYSPDQPRVPAGTPEGGQWTSEDGDQAASPGENSFDGDIDISGARRRRMSEAECDAQLKRDTIICNLVHTPLCWAQSMERYAACLSGRPIPDLRF